ncbi:deoxyribodipyrimidine photolyase [Nocardia sp. GAS34]
MVSIPPVVGEVRYKHGFIPAAMMPVRIRSHCAADSSAVRDSVTAVPPGALRPSSGAAHFAVFTPYFRRWLQTPIRTAYPAPDSLPAPELDPGRIPAAAKLCPEHGSPLLAVGGETTGRELLRAWLSGPVEQYGAHSDELAADATSGLSPYLHFGCLSAAELVHRTDLSTTGGNAFARQLAWRDFHHQLLAARTELAWTDYRPPPAPPRFDPYAADAWRAGSTGFPVIDAAMRQLLAQGWMPGRARLIAASFLTKTLHVDCCPLPALAVRRRHRKQPAQLAVGRWHRHRHPPAPHPQPNPAGRTPRPRRCVRPPLDS